MQEFGVKSEIDIGRETEKIFGLALVTLQNLRDFVGDFVGVFLTEVLDCALGIRNADFKGCVGLLYALLLFEKPSTLCRRKPGP